MIISLCFLYFVLIHTTNANLSGNKSDISNGFNNLSSIKTIFGDFKIEFNKFYSTVDEENYRFSNFLVALIKVNEHNKLFERGEKTYRKAINHMSDWNSEELLKLTTVKVSNYTGSLFSSLNTEVDLPESFDWREKGAVTEVKDQFNCGACYAFATAGVLEGLMYRKTGQLISLSVQQIIDCDNIENGCHGGSVQDTLSYIKRIGGLESENTYPYESGITGEKNDKCKFKKENVVATDTGFVNIPSKKEKKLQEALVSIAPIVVQISAPPSLVEYSNGIYQDEACDEIDINHAVLLVGYGIDKETKTPYWIIKNSWGSKWGENGFFRLLKLRNLCNVSTDALYPLL